MKSDTKLKRGTWLITADKYLYVYIGRPKVPGNTIILQELGPTSCINKKGHRPVMAWPDSFLDQLDIMNMGGST